MKSNPLMIDLAIALLAAILILVMTPGVAVAGMIALMVLLVCVASVVFESRRSRPPGPPRRKRPASARQRPPQAARPRAGR